MNYKTFSSLVISFLLLLEGANAHHLYSSLWCSGSHPESRACTFKHLCYSPMHDEFLFFRDEDRSSFSGILDPEETKELINISPHKNSDIFHLSTFKAEDANFNLEVKPLELLLIHIQNHETHSLDKLFIHTVLPLLKSLYRLCYGDIQHCTFPKIALKYEKGAALLPAESKDILRKIFSQDIIYEISPSSGEDEIVCYDKIHVGHLDEPYFGEFFREFILDRLGIDKSVTEQSILVLHSDASKERLPNHVFQEICSGCNQEDLVLNVHSTNEILRSLSSAKVIVSQDNILTPGLLMSQGSILIHGISSHGNEELSSDLLNIIKNRRNVTTGFWSPSEPSPTLSKGIIHEENDERLWIYPSRITGFECSLEIKSSELTVQLRWDPPLNSKYFSRLAYELYIQGMVSKNTPEEDLEFLDQFSVKERSAVFPVNAKVFSALKIYILAKVPLDEGFENKGIDASFICDLDQDIKFSS